MKISDWNIAGQLWSALTEIQNFCRECCRLMDVGPQILVWLNTPRGKEVLKFCVSSVVTRWKVEYESESRCNQILIDDKSFDKLVEDCYFEGWTMNIRAGTFPSKLTSVGQVIEFQEVATPLLLPPGGELVLLEGYKLRPAQPLEFLAWLKKSECWHPDIDPLCHPKWKWRIHASVPVWWRWSGFASRSPLARQ